MLVLLCASLACGREDEPTTNMEPGPNNAPAVDMAPGVDMPAENSATNAATNAEAGPCVVDLDRIEERRACISDDHCPCGSHCDLGVCVAECQQDSDCGDGQRCDTFGRCRAAWDTGIVPAPTGAPVGAFEISTPRLELHESVRSAELVIDTFDVTIPRMRVVATGGATFQCDGVAGASECVIEDIDAGSRIVLDIESDDPVTDGASVTIITDRSRASASVVEVRPLPSALALVDELPGVYTGDAVIRGAGIGATGAATDEPAEKFSVPLRAEIFSVGGDDYVIELSDSFHALSPTGTIVASLGVSDADPAAASISIPSHAVFSGGLERGSSYDIVATHDVVSARVTSGPSVLTFDVQQRFEGVLPDGEAPMVTWEIALVRERAPSGDPAPAIPGDAALSNDPNTTAFAPSPLEQALRSKSLGIVSKTHEELLAIAEQNARHTGGPVDVEACTYGDAADVEQIARITTWSAYGTLQGFSSSDYSTAMALAQAPYIFVKAFASALPADAVLQPEEIGGEVFRISAPVNMPVGDARSAFIPCSGSVSFDYSQTVYRDGCERGALLEEQSRRVDYTIPSDSCVQLAQRYGCEVEDIAPASVDLANGAELSAGRIEASGQVLGTPQPEPVCWLTSYENVALTYDKVCRFAPAVPVRCTEGVLCAEGSSWESSLFNDQLLEVSGDQACEVGDRVGALELDRRAELFLAKTRDLLDECMDEVRALRVDHPPMVVSGGGESLGELFAASPKCIDVSRHVLATSFAFGASRHGLVTETPEARARTSLGMRLVQRWLLLHAGAADEKRATADADIVFEGVNPGPGPLEVLEYSASGYDLLLHPRIATGIVGASDDSFTNPDYRGALGVQALPPTEHTAGLPATLYETMAAQLDLVSAYTERKALNRDTTAVDGIQTIMPRLVVVHAITNALAGRVDTSTAPWTERLDASRGQFFSSFRRARRATTSLTDGSNPLGIAESDLPLYFSGMTQGPGGTFSAVSDYIIGSPANTTAWAPFLVTRAQQSFASARAAFQIEIDRDYRARYNGNEYENKIGDVITDYDNQLSEFCGPQSTASVEDDTFSAYSCYIDNTPDCAFTALAKYEGFEGRDWAHLLCPHAEAQRRFGGSYGFNSPNTRDFADRACEERILSENECVGPAPCLRCRVGADIVAEITLDAGSLALDVPGTGGAVVQNVDAVKRGCEELYPGARKPRPTHGERTAARCFHGAIGEAALEVFAAERSLQLASQAISEHTEAYNIAVESCNILARSNTELEDLRTKHAENLNIMRGVKTGIEAAAVAAGETKDCLGTVAGADASGKAFAGGACAAGAAKAAFDIATLVLDNEIEKAITAHENAIAAAEGERDRAICMQDAKLELVGIESARISATQASIDLIRAYENVQDLQLEARTAWVSGRAQVRDLRASKVAPPTGGDWAVEEVETFTRRMQLARRALYLGVQAVEYEYQTSLVKKNDVLTAKTPDELQAVLEDLWVESGTGSIGGNKPTDLKVILSLRDDVLRLQDLTQTAVGHSVSPTARLRMILNDPQNVVRDDEGEVIGRRVPFSLEPLEALGISPEGIPVFAASDCAERVWSVNASILGANGASPFEGNDMTFSRLSLEKSNVFHSQWCQDGNEEPFQVASVRPSRNLFRSPGLEAQVGEMTVIPDPRETTTSARIEAYFNVTRDEFDADSYTNGATQELAGRGLYGEYALFIPEGLISMASQSGRTNGLVIDRIDDILLRIDYVSVAKR